MKILVLENQRRIFTKTKNIGRLFIYLQTSNDVSITFAVSLLRTKVVKSYRIQKIYLLTTDQRFSFTNRSGVKCVLPNVWIPLKHLKKTLKEKRLCQLLLANTTQISNELWSELSYIAKITLHKWSNRFVYLEVIKI